MPNYKDMYLAMVDASEKATNILIEAQRKAEEIYISSDEPELKILPSDEADEPEE